MAANFHVQGTVNADSGRFAGYNGANVRAFLSKSLRCVLQDSRHADAIANEGPMHNLRSRLLFVLFAIACNPPVDRNDSQPGHDNNPTLHL